MKCSVFIATSADGYIATEDGDVSWLDSAGDQSADLGASADMGFGEFMTSVDCLLMGRNTLEKLISFDLSEDSWPYGNTRIIGLSSSLNEVPGWLGTKVELFSGAIASLLAQLEDEGHQHAYVDGGALITSFLNAGLIDHIILTQAPVLLGSGIPLFRTLERKLALKEASAEAYANGFIQFRYQVSYSEPT